ncbi:trypsin-like peptidase domain-containing protein [Phormidium sp. CCY1219]|uniref:trypsin-like peptidase domain-containing protein n=1 Tax=Phormidium sp. CCY1219 TaxID=2886104 RepID=UPI002D1F0CF4|nr:trypsin-like peptidase domain-containing protein [Phormidium sp. CCY1219]MEB3831627.1 trypsin-like peptidase domain-containing protein [Phormidium sp. CCY1219]
MANDPIFPAAIIAVAAIATLPPPGAIAQLSAEQISAMAQQVTVIVNGQNPASGIIIGKENNTYFVLTAKHAIATEDEYQIVTAEGTEYPLNYSRVRKLPGVDLALIEFDSDRDYPLAQIGQAESTTSGTLIYIAGWPHPGTAITERIFQLTPGTISGRATQAAEDGYELVYTNITQSGMSGGPVFDLQGRLIGIHGRAEGQAIYNPDTGDSVAVKSGFNLGIPIETFIEVIQLAQLPPNPSFAYPLSDKGDRAFRENQLSEAIAAYETALKVDGEYVPALFRLAQGYYQSGNLGEAIARFQQANDLASADLRQRQETFSPTSPPSEQLKWVESQELQANTQLALATALYTQGDRALGLTLAFELFSHANHMGQRTLLEPTEFASDRLGSDAQGLQTYAQRIYAALVYDWPVEFNVGQALYDMGEIQQAIPYFERAMATERVRLQAKLALAIALYSSGDRQGGEALLGELRGESSNALDDTQFGILSEGFWSDRLLNDALNAVSSLPDSAETGEVIRNRSFRSQPLKAKRLK